jgi:hypothetical protein
MSKFKVGDEVTIKRCDIHGEGIPCYHVGELKSPYKITSADYGRAYPYRLNEDDSEWNDNELELVTTNNGDKSVTRRTFKLIKDSPTMKKGAILQEQCDDGTQPYTLLNAETHSLDPSFSISIAKRSIVEEQPKWFIEVFKAAPEWLTSEELEAYKAFMQKNKPAKAKTATPAVTKKSGWTPARRAAQIKRIKKA